MPSPCALKLEHIDLAYKTKTILHDITLEIPKGDFVFVIGRSGSGKSTLIKSIIGDLAPTMGNIYNEKGDDIYTLSSKHIRAYRRTCGVVFQDYKLLPKKTIFENVAFAMEVCGYKDALIAERVPEALSRVNLLKKQDVFPYELSGGELQRVAIARALVHDPDIIIGDEPTGNLDPKSADNIVDIFCDFHASGKTVIFATHDAPLVNRLKRRVIAFDAGCILSDTPQGTYCV